MEFAKKMLRRESCISAKKHQLWLHLTFPSQRNFQRHEFWSFFSHSAQLNFKFCRPTMHWGERIKKPEDSLDSLVEKLSLLMEIVFFRLFE